MLLGCLCLIEPLQSPIVSLIESPVFVVLDVVQIHLVRNGVPSLDCSLQDRGVAGIEHKSLILEHLASLDGLVVAMG